MKIEKVLSKLHPLKSGNRLFTAVVVVPTLISAIYFGLVASDVYISESKFVVRSPKSTASLTGLGAFLQSAGFARSADDTYTVHEYMHSRDALSGLNKDGYVQQEYSQSNIDWLSRFHTLLAGSTFEDLYQYFQDKIVLNLDTASSITTLRIKSYSPEVAQQINGKLLEQGEVLINQMNDKGRQDLIAYAETELTNATQKAETAALALNAYRVRNGIYDVPAQAQIQGQLVTKLQEQLMAIQTQLDQLRSVAPDNPQIPALKAREKSIRTEIDKQMAKVLGGGSSSLANKTGEYERLIIENKLAEKQIATALTSLDAAKSDAQKKQLYLERIVQPNKPEVALEPRRLYKVVTTAVLGLLVFGILRLMLSSVKEHRG